MIRFFQSLDKNFALFQLLYLLDTSCFELNSETCLSTLIFQLQIIQVLAGCIVVSELQQVVRMLLLNFPFSSAN